MIFTSSEVGNRFVSSSTIPPSIKPNDGVDGTTGASGRPLGMTGVRSDSSGGVTFRSMAGAVFPGSANVDACDVIVYLLFCDLGAGG
jgi:hypothetical protein